MSAAEFETEMVRPHDLRDGDQVVVAGEVRTVTMAPLPRGSAARHEMIAATDHGPLSWSMRAAQWPCVERVARADRQVA